MKSRPSSHSRKFLLVLSALLVLSMGEQVQAKSKGVPPTPTPAPTPTPTPTPAPTPTPSPTPGATPVATPPPANTAQAANSDTTIDNRFVTMAIQLGDGRNQAAMDTYANSLIHCNARIATAQGFYTSSQRGTSGVIQNPTPTATPSVDQSTVIRNDPPPQTAVDWGWVGNKKPKKLKH